jgi:hypothetical protein
MHKLNLMLPVRGVEDPITSATAHSYNQGSCIEKERHQWGEQVVATRFTQRLIIARPNDPDLCRNTMKYRNTHKCRDAAENKTSFH